MQVFIQLFIIIVGTSITVFNHTKHLEMLDSQVTEALNKRLNVITTGINDRLDLYHYGLNAIRSAIHGIGIDNLNYQTIANYSYSHNDQLELPGANGIGFIKSVSRKELSNFLIDAQNDRPDNNFKVKLLNNHVRTQFIIQYIFPEDKNKQAIGLDIGSETMRRTAALNAASNNQVQLTGPITLVQANKKAKQGFLILLPVYKSIIAPTNSEERINELIGWTYSPLLIDEVLKSLESFDLNHLRITDVSDSAPLTFFTYGNEQDITDYVVSSNASVMGRNWNITLEGTNAFIDELRLPQKYEVLLNGGLLTLLVMLTVLAGQLVYYRKAQKAYIEKELAKKYEQALEKANISLEAEIKARTEQLAKTNMLQRSILNSASYSVIATDIKGVITEFNPAAEKLLGYKAAEIIGIETPALFHIEEEVIAQAKRLSKELNMPVGANFDVFALKASMMRSDVNQWTYKTATGKFIQVKLNITAMLNNNEEVVGYVGIAYDLTAQIAHEKALADAKNQAEKASLAKSEFLANMSHEIRTPMNGIFGTLQLLQELSLNNKAQEYVKTALYSTKALTTIINDILDFSKIEAGKLSIENKTFELDELITCLHSDLSIPANDKNLNLTFNLSVEQNYWLGDSVRLRQVFLNVIANAIKFTHKGGITIDITLNEQGALVFVVADTGIGMSQEAISRLFKRFEQADASTTREYGGTGLGLSITRSLIELMNGTITVESELNVGSKFIITLPLKKAEAIANNKSVKALKHPDLSGKIILLAEDNKINQVVATAMLEPCNATIVIANNGLEAISLYKEISPDIIFMDIQMPKMDGVEACKKIKRLDNDQIIIALTANVLSEQKALYKKHFNGYLAKPIEKAELIEMLHSLFP